MDIKYEPKKVSEFVGPAGNASLKDVQEKVHNFANERAWNIIMPSARGSHLTREVGKLMEYTLYEEGVTTKRPADFETKYKKQFGDVLFSLAAYANLMNIDLGAAFAEALKQDEAKYPAAETRKEALKAYKERTKMYSERLAPQ